MKQSNLSEPATKNDILILKSNSENRFKKLEDQIASLDKKQQAYLKIAKLDTQIVVNQAVEKLTQVVAAFTDKIITRFDPLLQELETNREYRIIATKDTYEIKNRLDNLEKRVESIEKN